MPEAHVEFQHSSHIANCESIGSETEYIQATFATLKDDACILKDCIGEALPLSVEHASDEFMQ